MRTRANPNIVDVQIDSTFFTGRNIRGAESCDPFRENPWVYAAIMAIARAVSSTPLVVMQGSGKSAARARMAARSASPMHALMLRERAIRQGKASPAPDGNPLVKLFEDPCPAMSVSQLMQVTVILLLTRGDEFWVKLGQNQRAKKGEIPVELWPQNPKKYEAGDVNPKTMMPDYWLVDGNTRIGIDEVVHFRQVNPDLGFKGMAPTEPADDAIESDGAAVTFNKNFFKNGAMPGGIFTHPNRLTDAQKKDFKGWVKEQVAGLDKAQSEMLLDNGVTFSWNPRTQKDAEFMAMRDRARDEILACIGTAKGILSITDDLNYATFIGMKRAFFENTVIPLLYDIEDTLWTDIFQDVDGGKYYAEFDLKQVAALKDDLAQQAGVAKQFFDMGWSRDEVNERLQLGFTPDPSTDIRGGPQQTDMLALPEATEPVPGVVPPGATTVQDTAMNGAQVSSLVEVATKVAEGVLPKGAAKAILTAAFPTITPPQADDIIDGIELLPPPEPAPMPSGPPRGESESQYWAEVVLARGRRDLRQTAEDWTRRVRAASIAEMRAAIRRWMLDLTENQRARFMAYIEKMKADKLTPQDIERILFQRARWDAALANAAYQPMRNTQALELRRTAMEIGVPVIPVTDPAMLEMHANRVASLVKIVGPGAQQQIRTELIKASSEGMSIEEMRQAVKDGELITSFAGEEASWKSLRIARTETGFMTSGARYGTAERNASIIDHREWLHIASEDEREDHVAESEGPGVPVGVRYPVTGLLHPREFGAPADQVINCNCDELLIPKENI